MRVNKLKKGFGILIIILVGLLVWYFVRVSSVNDPGISYTKPFVTRTFGAEVLDSAPQDIRSHILSKSWFLTCERYGKKIVYYSLSKIPDNLVLNRKIELPLDLKEFLEYEYNNPRIENSIRFEQDFWEEASKLGYTHHRLKNAGIKEAIMATVEIACSRFTYFDVDNDSGFIKKYGEHLSTDDYFHLGRGDCKRYKHATIGVFHIIKKLNSRLQNVYLSEDDLGGNHGTQHAWVSIVIPQNDCLILSHIDPTFYDNGYPLEASKYHICLDYNIFMMRFYISVSIFAAHFDDGYSYIYAYQLMYEEFPEIKKARWRKWVLNEMSDVNYKISYSKPLVALNNAPWILERYEAEGFSDNLDKILAYTCYVYRNANRMSELEKYKQRLLNEFPSSPWTYAVKRE